MGDGGGLKHVTINPVEGGGSSRLRRLRVAADAPVFGARSLHSRDQGELWAGERGRLVRGDHEAHTSLTDLRSSADYPPESEQMTKSI